MRRKPKLAGELCGAYWESYLIKTRPAIPEFCILVLPLLAVDSVAIPLPLSHTYAREMGMWGPRVGFNHRMGTRV